MKRAFVVVGVVACAIALLGCSDDDSSSGATGGASGSAGASGASGAAGGGGSGGGSGGAPSEPKAQFVPAPTGACPELTDGMVTFSPAGIPARSVRIWISEAATTLDGPLVFYWHGTGSSPLEAAYGIGDPQLAAILAQGGIVAAPSHDPSAGQFPWFLTIGSGKDDDLRVADEILACAIEKVGVDLRRVHSMGMSAGGLQTVQLGFRRSGYIASVAPYSGGLLGAPENQDPDNKFAAMIMHGGESDVVIIGFKGISETYQKQLSDAGHFAFLCDHGGGHSIPTDARPSVWEFLQAHPFGSVPSPYAAGLPSGFPTYCALP